MRLPLTPHTSADPTSYVTKTNMGMFSRKAEAKFDPVAQPRVTVDDFWRAPRANNKQLQRNRMETIVFGARTTMLKALGLLQAFEESATGLCFLFFRWFKLAHICVQVTTWKRFYRANYISYSGLRMRNVTWNPFPIKMIGSIDSLLCPFCGNNLLGRMAQIFR